MSAAVLARSAFAIPAMHNEKLLTQNNRVRL
jgi:hypothetical protein